jgi:ribosomal protein L35AE/L33A
MELDKFVEIDERVRMDLDRKKHVEYLKEKNSEEITRSIIKVKTSQSPKKESSYVVRTVHTVTTSK